MGGLTRAAIACVAFSATVVGHLSAQSSPSFPAEATIRAMLDSSAAAWNRGDVRGHLATNSDSISFMTRRGPVVGNDSVVARMTQAYFPQGRPTQMLRFDRVTVRPMGERFALVVGQFLLTGGGKPDQSGWFTTVWEHRAEGWRVIHDHSS